MSFITRWTLVAVLTALVLVNQTQAKQSTVLEPILGIPAIPEAPAHIEFQNATENEMVPLIGITVLPDSLGRGLFVNHVIPGSPAAGILKIGNIITSIDDAPITMAEQIEPLLKKTVDGKARIGVLSQTGAFEFEMKIGKMVKIHSLGVTIGTSTSTSSSVVVAVDPGSTATRCYDVSGNTIGLEAGDRIFAVNDQKVENLNTILEAQRSGGSLKLLVQDVRNPSVFRDLTLGQIVAQPEPVQYIEQPISFQPKFDLPPMNQSGEVQFKGRVVFNDFEGGFYGVVTDTGEKYNIGNLPAELKQDGTRVQGTVRLSSNRFSTRMWGIMADVIEIKAEY